MSGGATGRGDEATWGTREAFETGRCCGLGYGWFFRASAPAHGGEADWRLPAGTRARNNEANQGAWEAY